MAAGPQNSRWMSFSRPSSVNGAIMPSLSKALAGWGTVVGSVSGMVMVLSVGAAVPMVGGLDGDDHLPDLVRGVGRGVSVAAFLLAVGVALPCSRRPKLESEVVGVGRDGRRCGRRHGCASSGELRAQI